MGGRVRGLEGPAPGSAGGGGGGCRSGPERCVKYTARSAVRRQWTDAPLGPEGQGGREGAGARLYGRRQRPRVRDARGAGRGDGYVVPLRGPLPQR